MPACTITQWTLVGDQSGSAVIDLWKCTYAQFDSGGTHPVVGDSMIGTGNKPTLSSVTKNQAAPSGWNTVTCADGDVIGVYLNSASTVTKLTLQLSLTLL